jgi:hypothetical protein
MVYGTLDFEKKEYVQLLQSWLPIVMMGLIRAKKLNSGK